MKKYQTAIIGCGNIASLFDKEFKRQVASTHAGAYNMHPRTDLVAACDVDVKRLKDFSKKWGVTRIYTDYNAMLRNEKIDILSVCTPPKTHCPIVLDAVKSKVRAIYCEKPIAVNVPDAQKMIKACQSKKILLMINHQRRFSPFWQEVRSKIAHGFLGDIQQVNCFYTRGVYNTGTHILDLFTFLFGPAAWTMSVSSMNTSPIPNDPNLDGMVLFKSGLSVSMKACNDSNYLIFEIDILGSKGRLRVGRQVEYFEAMGSKNLLGRKELVGPQKYPFKSDDNSFSLDLAVEHIINCLEGKDDPISCGSHALESLKIIRAMITSSQKEKPVHIGEK